MIRYLRRIPVVISVFVCVLLGTAAIGQALKWGGPMTGIADLLGNQLFVSGNPGYVTGTTTPAPGSNQKVNIDQSSPGTSNGVVNTIAALTPVAGSQEALTVATATALTVPVAATTAIITVEGNSIRWRADGTAPTSSSGTLVQVGSVMTFKLTSFANLRFIQIGATATLDVEYFQ